MHPGNSGLPWLEYRFLAETFTCLCLDAYQVYTRAAASALTRAGCPKDREEWSQYICRVVRPTSGLDPSQVKAATRNSLFDRQGGSLRPGVPLRALTIYLWEKFELHTDRQPYCDKFLAASEESGEAYPIVWEQQIFLPDEAATWQAWKQEVLSVRYDPWPRSYSDKRKSITPGPYIVIVAHYVDVVLSVCRVVTREVGPASQPLTGQRPGPSPATPREYFLCVV